MKVVIFSRSFVICHMHETFFIIFIKTNDMLRLKWIYLIGFIWIRESEPLIQLWSNATYFMTLWVHCKKMFLWSIYDSCDISWMELMNDEKCLNALRVMFWRRCDLWCQVYHTSQETLKLGGPLWQLPSFMKGLRLVYMQGAILGYRHTTCALLGHHIASLLGHG